MLKITFLTTSLRGRYRRVSPCVPTSICNIRKFLRMHLDLEIPRLKDCIKSLALETYVSAKLGRNGHIKKLDTESIVYNRRFPRPFQILLVQ